MSNMSYCRFENTERDLADCKDALEGMSNGDKSPLSLSELRAAKRLAAHCADILALLAEVAGAEVEELLDFPDTIDEALDALNENAADLREEG
jgi:hypothetical protein